MRGLLRWTGRVALALIVLAGLAAAYVYLASERRLNQKFPVTTSPVLLPADSASLARGEHLVRNVTTCLLCHGRDAGGGVYADMGPIGRVVGPNLTAGRGGVGATLRDEDWVRALRHGVRRDGTSLIAMPSEVFAHLHRGDLASIIAYMKRLPPVDRELPPTKFGPLGRALLASGRLNILVAPKTPNIPLRDSVVTGATIEHGHYLADIAGCHGCHGFGLSGGRVAGPPGLPPASNLTPAGAIRAWNEAQFARAVRAGIRPDGTRMNEFMPSRTYAGMTDEEIRALWLYLRSVPARAFGNK